MPVSRPDIDNETILSAVPVRVAEHEMNPSNLVTLLQPKTIRGPLKVLFAKMVES